MFNIGNTYKGMASSDFSYFDNHTRIDDVLPTTSTGERTSNMVDIGRFENEDDSEFDANLICEPDPVGSEITLFFEPSFLPTKPEDGERGENLDEDTEEDSRFKAYLPPTHMHNVNLSVEDGMEFKELPHRRPVHASSSLDSGDLEVEKEFSTKDRFVAIMKRYNIRNGLNFHVVKSRSEKFEVKCVMRDSGCT